MNCPCADVAVLFCITPIELCFLQSVLQLSQVFLFKIILKWFVLLVLIYVSSAVYYGVLMLTECVYLLPSPDFKFWHSCKIQCDTLLIYFLYPAATTSHVVVMCGWCIAGTGKTITAIKIAYWFAQLNNTKASENAGKEIRRKQVMYCGPSNSAVDVAMGKHVIYVHCSSCIP